MYLCSFTEVVAGARSGGGDRTGFPNGASNAGEEALLDMGLQQDVVYSSDSGFRRYIVVGITGNEDNWRGDIAAAQPACEIDAVNIGHFIIDHKTIGFS